MKIYAYFLSIIMISGSAFACDLSKLPFGSSQKQVMGQYNINPMPLMDENSDMLAERGKVICDEWPEGSLFEFNFLNNNLVSVNIENESQKNDIFDLSQKYFGENDDSDRKSAKNNKQKIAVWGENRDYVAFYSSKSVGKNDVLENLSITSKKHQSLIDANNKKNGQAINQYMKDKGLGKYSSDAKKSVPATSSGSYKAPTDVRGNYDKDALKKLKEKYEKRNREFKD